MNTIKLKIFNKLLDSFYYMGRLFVITEDRRFAYITQGQLFDKYIKRFKNTENALLKSILFDNKTLARPDEYEQNPNYQVFFTKCWKQFSTEKFEFQIAENDLIFLCSAPEKEPLDFVMYGRRAVLANRDGIHECILDIEIGVTRLVKPFEKVFDSKTIALNPRIGEILVSTTHDGLFRASLWDINRNIRVEETPIQKTSIKTAWAKYNFVNYIDSTESKLFINETTKDVDSVLSKSIKDDDGASEMIKVSSFAKSEVKLNQFLPDAVKDEIIFSYNSLTYYFFITRDGSIRYAPLGDSIEGGIQSLEIKIDTEALGKPLSAIPMTGGTVYEFFEKILFIKNNKSIDISDVESKQVKTFGSSIRYKNILSILTEKHLEIHSIFPY